MFAQPVLAAAEHASPLAAQIVKIAFIPVLFTLTYFLARISWVVVEEPLLRLKDRLS
jgi:peptidoglycan/LPS O-acetylase OafA/YrhL